MIGKEGTPRICKLWLGGVRGDDFERARFADFDMLILNNDHRLEHPDLEFGHTEVWDYYDMAGAWKNWAEHPPEKFVYHIGGAASLHALWLPPFGQTRPNSRTPAVDYPDGRGALLNWQLPVTAAIWAGLVADSMRANTRIYLDNCNSMKWKAPWIDEAVWMQMLHYALCRLRGDNPQMIGNGRNTFGWPLNGRMIENLGSSWQAQTYQGFYEDLERHFRPIYERHTSPVSGFRRLHIVHASAPYHLYGLACSLLRPDTVFAASEAQGLHQSEVWMPEFELDLGLPASGDPEVRNGEWRKEYEKAWVVANHDTKTGSIEVRP